MWVIIRPWRGTLEGRGFDLRLCHWNFPLTQSFQPHYGPGVDSAPNRNEYQEYFLGGGWGKACPCVGLITLTSSYADCLEIWDPLPPGTLRACQACNRIALHIIRPWHKNGNIYRNLKLKFREISPTYVSISCLCFKPLCHGPMMNRVNGQHWLAY